MHIYTQQDACWCSESLGEPTQPSQAGSQFVLHQPQQAQKDTCATIGPELERRLCSLAPSSFSRAAVQPIGSALDAEQLRAGAALPDAPRAFSRAMLFGSTADTSPSVVNSSNASGPSLPDAPQTFSRAALFQR